MRHSKPDQTPEDATGRVARERIEDAERHLHEALYHAAWVEQAQSLSEVEEYARDVREHLAISLLYVRETVKQIEDGRLTLTSGNGTVRLTG